MEFQLIHSYKSISSFDENLLIIKQTQKYSYVRLTLIQIYKFIINIFFGGGWVFFIIT